MKAYFTERKLTEYFLEGTEMDPKVFDYLKKPQDKPTNRKAALPLSQHPDKIFCRGSLKSVRGSWGSFNGPCQPSPLGRDPISVYQRLPPPYSCSGYLWTDVVEYHGDRDQAPLDEIRLPGKTSFHQEEMEVYCTRVMLQKEMVLSRRTLEIIDL